MPRSILMAIIEAKRATQMFLSCCSEITLFSQNRGDHVFELENSKFKVNMTAKDKIDDHI